MVVEAVFEDTVALRMVQTRIAQPLEVVTFTRLVVAMIEHRAVLAIAGGVPRAQIRVVETWALLTMHLAFEEVLVETRLRWLLPLFFPVLLAPGSISFVYL